MSHTKHTKADREAVEKLGRKRYEKELARLQGELVRLQEWVVREGIKVCVVFEGRDTAGKGGVIKRITERVSPRVFRVVALPAPTEREKSQMYVQRYLPHFPAAGEVVIFEASGDLRDREALRLAEVACHGNRPTALGHAVVRRRRSGWRHAVEVS